MPLQIHDTAVQCLGPDPPAGRGGKNAGYTAAGLVALFPFTAAEVAAARELRNTAVLIWKVHRDRGTPQTAPAILTAAA